MNSAQTNSQPPVFPTGELANPENISDNSIAQESLSVQPKIDVRFFMDDEGHIVPAKLARYIITQIPMFYDGATLYAYHNGVYRTNGFRVASQYIQHLLGDRHRRHVASETIEYIETATWVDTRHINPDDGLINVKNGLLDWKTDELLSHNPKRLSTIQLPVEYDSTATCPEISKYMNSVLPADTLPVVTEMFGYSMIPSTKFEKAFMLTANGGNGKSVFIKLLTAFIGKENTSNVPLQDLEGNRFKLAQLYGKMLNVFADLPHKALETTSIFKSIVSGDRMSAEFKGRDSFDFEPFARLVFSANEIPHSPDLTKGFFRRWIIIPFIGEFEHGVNADENIAERMITPSELSGLLNVALDGLRRLHLQRQFTVNESTTRALEDYRRNTDNLSVFLDEMCIIDPPQHISKGVLFDTYKRWCMDSNLRPLGKIKFNDRLQQQIKGLREERPSKVQPWEWVGVGLLDPFI